MYRTDLETAPPEMMSERQLVRLNTLLSRALPGNAFYGKKYGALSSPLSWDEFYALPFTTKAELVDDQLGLPPLGEIATYPSDEYVAYHQTSGTTGRPLVILDTQESWDWWAECWRYVYAAAGVTARDRIFFAFSFGPFIGFWSAYAAACGLGAMPIPGGGLDSRSRLRLMESSGATVLLCTPTYALRLAEVAGAEGMSLRNGAVRVTVHAGESGASIPSVRSRIENAWGAASFDHAGGTEVGAYGFSCEARTGLHVNEAEFIAEVLNPETGLPCAKGSAGELVITNLGRVGWPAIRYRTGDIVTLGDRSCACGRTFLMLPDGIIGRTDDLIVLRGVNVYPSSIESIVRMFDVREFRIIRTRKGASDELTVEVEASDEIAVAVSRTFRDRFGLRIPTRVVPPESLPRWELKARRVVDARVE